MSQVDTQVFMDCEKKIKSKYNSNASGQGLSHFKFLQQSLADYFGHFSSDNYDDYPDQ